jgi:hypothetical protein
MSSVVVWLCVSSSMMCYASCADHIPETISYYQVLQCVVYTTTNLSLSLSLSLSLLYIYGYLLDFNIVLVIACMCMHGSKDHLMLVLYVEVEKVNPYFSTMEPKLKKCWLQLVSDG